MRSILIVILLSSCTTVQPLFVNRHLDPVCVVQPYEPIVVEAIPARDLDAGPYVVDTGVLLSTEVDHDFIAGEGP